MFGAAMGVLWLSTVPLTSGSRRADVRHAFHGDPVRLRVLLPSGRARSSECGSAATFTSAPARTIWSGGSGWRLAFSPRWSICRSASSRCSALPRRPRDIGRVERSGFGQQHERRLSGACGICRQRSSCHQGVCCRDRVALCIVDREGEAALLGLARDPLRSRSRFQRSGSVPRLERANGRRRLLRRQGRTVRGAGPRRRHSGARRASPM